MGLLDKKTTTKTDRIYEFEAYLEGTVIAANKIENTFTTNDGKPITQRYLEVTVVDDDGRAFYLKDKQLENEPLYTRGAVGVFALLIRVEEKFKGKTTVTVTAFAPDRHLELSEEG